MPDASNRFPTTQWTSVEHAGEPEAGALSLDRLLSKYLSPLRAHLVMQKRIPPDRADDLLQGFVTDKVLERNLVGQAVRGKGRFRTFLLVALDRYVSNQLRGEQRRARRNGQADWDQGNGEPVEGEPTPSQAYELAWARQVLALAASKMREECEKRPELWAIFEGRVLSPTLEGAEVVPYSVLAEQLGLPSEEAGPNLLATAKRMYARNLNRVVGEYMGEDGELDDEVRELRNILARG